MSAAPPLPERWIFKKEVSIADVIAFVSSMSFVVVAWATLDKRITLLEAAQIEQHRTDIRQDQEAIKLGGEIKQELQRLNDKLDRVIERSR